MTFKDIKQNFPVYILDKSTCEITKGKVVSTSFPHLETSTMQQIPNPCVYPGSPNPSNQRMVIDLTIEANGNTATYVVSENASINYANNLVIAPEQSALIPEVEAIKNNADQALSPERIEMLKQHQAKSTKLLMDLNPAFRQQQEYDQRLNGVESSISELKDMMANFIKEFKN